MGWQPRLCASPVSAHPLGGVRTERSFLNYAFSIRLPPRRRLLTSLRRLRSYHGGAPCHCGSWALSLPGSGSVRQEPTCTTHVRCRLNCLSFIVQMRAEWHAIVSTD